MLPGSCLQPLGTFHQLTTSARRQSTPNPPKPSITGRPRPPPVAPKHRPRSVAFSSEMNHIPILGVTSDDNYPLKFQHLRNQDHKSTDLDCLREDEGEEEINYHAEYVDLMRRHKYFVMSDY